MLSQRLFLKTSALTTAAADFGTAADPDQITDLNGLLAGFSEVRDRMRS